MQILEDQQQGLHLAFPDQQTLDGLQGVSPALRGIQSLPGGVLHRHVEQGEDRGEGRLQGLIEGEELAGHFLAHPSSVVTGLDADIGLEQIHDREIGGGLAVGHGATLQDEPALGAMGVE